MTAEQKPDLAPTWASEADTTQIHMPNINEIAQGFPEPIGDDEEDGIEPSRQRMNWLFRWISRGINGLLSVGCTLDWDANISYQAGAVVSRKIPPPPPLAKLSTEISIDGNIQSWVFDFNPPFSIGGNDAAIVVIDPSTNTKYFATLVNFTKALIQDCNKTTFQTSGNTIVGGLRSLIGCTPVDTKTFLELSIDIASIEDPFFSIHIGNQNYSVGQAPMTSQDLTDLYKNEIYNCQTSNSLMDSSGISRTFKALKGNTGIDPLNDDGTNWIQWGLLPTNIATKSKPGLIMPDNTTLLVSNAGVLSTALSQETTMTNATNGIGRPDWTTTTVNESGIFSCIPPAPSNKPVQTTAFYLTAPFVSSFDPPVINVDYEFPLNTEMKISDNNKFHWANSKYSDSFLFEKGYKYNISIFHNFLAYTFEFHPIYDYGLIIYKMKNLYFSDLLDLSDTSLWITAHSNGNSLTTLTYFQQKRKENGRSIGVDITSSPQSWSNDELALIDDFQQSPLIGFSSYNKFFYYERSFIPYKGKDGNDLLLDPQYVVHPSGGGDFGNSSLFYLVLLEKIPFGA